LILHRSLKLKFKPEIKTGYTGHWHYYSTRSYASAEYWIHFTVRFGGVHTFSYNFAESEPIWMKSGTLWVHGRRQALADFGRDPRGSDSWRARRNFFVK